MGLLMFFSDKDYLILGVLVSAVYEKQKVSIYYVSRVLKLPYSSVRYRLKRLFNGLS